MSNPKSPRRPRAKAAPVAQKPAADAQANGARLAVVGIGASAGGLEALEQFFAHVPPEAGLAYVVVQHLDPTHKGMMAELLQRATKMPVAQISDGQQVQPDRVYVIPPGHDLAMLDGTLHLLEPAAQRGLRLPIDHFFRSLAADRREAAVGVILSGMGSDGTLGLRAIKENAGAVFVQSPDSAKFDAMPRSAIDAGLADVVAKAEELPARILAFLNHQPMPAAPAPAPAAAGADDISGLAKLVLLLRERTGHDFSQYRKSTLLRRIERRMGLHQLSRMGDYVRLLRDSRQEATLLFQELLIGVTSFFRDPAVWQQVSDELMPALLASRPDGGTLRVWVPGCSTGEEAYGLAMVFREALAQAATHASITLQVFATDLDKTAIDKARAAWYPAGIAADMSDARLRRFFVEDADGWRVNKDIREMVVFAPQNMVIDPPFTRLDLLSCRNLLIYLEPELQKKLIALFHYSLVPGGMLLLGSAETIGNAADLFTPLPGKARLYRRLSGPVRDEVAVFPAAFASTRPPQMHAGASQSHGKPTAPQPDLKQLTEGMLLNRFAPAAVLVTAQADILHISGKTGRFLEPAAGKANLNLMAMAREGLDHALAEGFYRALRDRVAVVQRGVKVGLNGSSVWLDVHVLPLEQPAAMQGLALVVFDELPAQSATHIDTAKAATDLPHDPRLASLQDELQRAHMELQATREEMQASQEELKSTNEELQSTNEELQSTNEELTTSKEEMQSMNEELQTLNHELLAKVDELAHTADDMDNLLNSTQLATLFLDTELHVRRYTPATTNLVKLIPGDVGRPVTDLVTTLIYPEMADDARSVLRTLSTLQREVPAKAGGWFVAQVMPYRTRDNRINGLVLTFTDISAAKSLEATLIDTQSLLEKRLADRDAQLHTAHELEATLREAHGLLQQRLAREERTSTSMRKMLDAQPEAPALPSAKPGEAQRKPKPKP